MLIIKVHEVVNQKKYFKKKEKKKMAKNWTMAEAVSAIKAGDTDAIQDIGKRYPLLANKIAVLLAKAAEEFEEIMAIMPEYVTANKLNKALIDGIDADENDEDEEEQEAKEQTKAKAKKPATKKAAKNEDADEDYSEDDEEDDSDAPFDENMSSKEMYALCGKLGIKKTLKDTKKPTMIAALKKYYAENGADEEAGEGAVEDEDKYAGKKAIDLYNECKKRGMRVKPKQKASYYADLLKKDDAAKADADDEDWGEEDDEKEEKPAKKSEAKKPAASTKKPAAKKPAKEEAEDEDDDDDWDI